MSAERAVILAIQAAGRFDDEWESRVHMAVPIVAGLLREHSQAMVVANEVLESSAIFATFVGKHLEESSQRLIVSFQADNGDDVETIRTHRIDESAGAAMNLRLIGMQPGDRMLLFKTVDKVNSKMAVRILAGFERLPSRNAHVATPPQRPRGTGAVRPTAAPPQRAVEAPAPNPNRAAVIRGLLDQLSTEDQLKARQLLVKHKWEGVDDIGEGTDWEHAMYIARHAKDDWF